MKAILPFLRNFFTFYLLSLAGAGIFVFLGGQAALDFQMYPIRLIPAAAVPIAVLVYVIWIQREKIKDLEERIQILEQKRRNNQ